jgi:hypothetical protein
MPTVAQLRERARAHNKVHCIKLSQRKAGLMSALAKSTAGSGAGASASGAGSAGASAVKKKKRVKQKAMKNMLSPAQVEQLVNASGASGAGAGNGNKKKKRIKPVLASPLGNSGAGAPASASGGTVGQKNFAKKMSKMKKAYQKLGGKDANKDLAF